MTDYGADVSTFPDLDVSGKQIADPSAVAECVMRRWMTNRGSIEYDRDAGFNLQDLLNEDLSEGDLRMKETLAAIEAEKDERVRTATVTFTLDRSAFRLRVRAQLELVTDRTFTLTADVTKITSTLLSVE